MSYGSTLAGLARMCNLEPADGLAGELAGWGVDDATVSAVDSAETAVRHALELDAHADAVCINIDPDDPNEQQACNDARDDAAAAAEAAQALATAAMGQVETQHGPVAAAVSEAGGSGELADDADWYDD